MTQPSATSSSVLDYQRAHPDRFPKPDVALEVARYLIHEFSKFRGFDSIAGESALAHHIALHYGSRCEAAFLAGLDEVDIGEELVRLIEVGGEELAPGAA